MNRLLDIKTHKTTKLVIADLMNTTKSSAHIKDAKSGIYLETNLINLKKFGFTHPHDFIGTSIIDLNKLMKGKWSSQLANEIIRLEQYVINDLKTVKEKRIFLDINKRLIIHEMTKIPVRGFNRSVCAIFTISDDLTYQLQHSELLNHYRLFFNAKDSVLRYLIHTDSQKFFSERPTFCELMILFKKNQNYNSKQIANLLNISCKTVDWHMGNLKKKTNINKFIEHIKLKRL